MKEIEINIIISKELRDCKTVRYLKHLYPNCTAHYNGVSHKIYKLEDNLYCRAYFKLYNGESLENIESYSMANVNYNHITISHVFTLNNINPERKINIETKVLNMLSDIRNDHQLDPHHDIFLGFVNIFHGFCSEHNEALVDFVRRPKYYSCIVNMLGLEVVSVDIDETIFKLKN